MKNKSGQFFELYLVILTLFMCALVIGLLFIHQQTARSALVSPRAVFDVRDDLEVYEMKERELIMSSLPAEGFGTEEFLASFRSNFLEGVSADDFMKEFVFENLTISGKSIESDARKAGSTFFENVLYKEEGLYYEGEKLIFERSAVEKSLSLNSDEGSYKISFPVEFNFNFEKKYLISKKGNEYILEEG